MYTPNGVILGIMKLCELIRSAIKSRNESVNSIARSSGVPQQVLQRFATGERDNLRLDTLEKLLAVLDFTISHEGETVFDETSRTAFLKEFADFCEAFRAFSELVRSSHVYVLPVAEGKYEARYKRLIESMSKMKLAVRSK